MVYELKTSESIDELEIKNMCSFIRHAIENENKVIISVQRRKITISPKELEKVSYFGDNLLIRFNDGKMTLFNPHHISMIEVV